MIPRLLRLCLSICIFSAAGICLLGQTPAGFVTVSGAFVSDSSGNLEANGTIYFAPVNSSGSAISYRIAGHGQSLQLPVQASVVNGFFTILIADTSLTSPVNVCFNVTIIDNVSGNSILGPGYSCVQPSGSGTAVTGSQAWCLAGSGGAGGLCNFDNYTPSLAALVVTQAGPVGPTGATGATGSAGTNGTNGATGATGPPPTFTGAWSSSPTYSTGNVVSSGGNSFAALTGNTNVAPPSSCTSNATWALLACGSASGTWGLIGGSLTSQADLASALALKSPVSSTGNGSAYVNSLDVTPGTNHSGVQTSNYVLVPTGNSTVANDAGIANTYQPFSAFPSQQFYGMTFLNPNGAYSCDASNNLTITVPNSNGNGGLAIGVGDWIGFVSAATPQPGNVTGPLNYAILYAAGAGGFLVTAATSTTLTFNTGSPYTYTCVSASGTITNAAVYVTPNIIKQGYGGQTLATITTSYLINNTIPLLQAEVALGKVPIFELREGLINDVRQDQTNFATAIALEKTALTLVSTASGLSSIPMLIVGEESLNSATSGGTYLCPAGTPTGGDCTATVNPPTLSTAVTVGANTITLTPGSGLTAMPPSIWPGPGMPIVVSSQGNGMQLVIDTTGSGVQETVTVTAETCSVTSSTVYACTLTFTAVNAHSSGAPVVATRGWMAQVATDELEKVVQTAKSWVNQFPTLKVLDTQNAFYGRYASPTSIPAWMADNLHLNSWGAEDAAVSQMIAPLTSSPAAVAPPAPVSSLTNGNSINPPEFISELVPLVSNSHDQYFSEYYANNARSNQGYWNPWVASRSAGGLAVYADGCADPNYFATVASGNASGVYTAGASSFAFKAQITSGGLVNIRAGAGTTGDVLLIGGQCFSGAIASIAANTASALWSVTLNSPFLPISFSFSTPILIQRYKTFDASGLIYMRNPDGYPYHVQGFLSGGGTGVYDVNALQANIPHYSPYLSVTGGYIFSFATHPVTSMALDFANIGNGLAVNGDVVSFPCGGTNATGTLSVQNGYPYAVTIASIGSSCAGWSQLSQAVTDTTTPAATGLKLFIGSGALTLPSVAGTVQSTHIGTGSPATYANGDTVTQICTTTNATWLAEAVTSGVPAYLKPVSAGVGCTAATNGATTTSGSGTGLTVDTVVTAATACTRTTATNFVACTDSTGTPYSLYNNLAMDIYAAQWPDSFATNATAKVVRLINPTVANLGTNVTGASGGSADVNVILGGSILPGSLTTTAATSDNVTIPGMVSTGHCSVDPTNSAAISATQAGVTAKTTNQVTVTHAATAGMTYDVVCTTY